MSEVAEKKAVTGKQAMQWLNSRTSVNEPGKYALQVVSSNPYEGRIILGLKAQSSEGLAIAKEHLRAGEFAEAANTNMSTSVFPDAYVPAKGEHVSCMVDYVKNRKDEMVLGVVSVSEIKAKSTAKVSLGDEFANLLDSKEDTSSDDNTPD